MIWWIMLVVAAFVGALVYNWIGSKTSRRSKRTVVVGTVVNLFVVPVVFYGVQRIWEFDERQHAADLQERSVDSLEKQTDLMSSANWLK